MKITIYAVYSGEELSWGGGAQGYPGLQNAEITHHVIAPSPAPRSVIRHVNVFLIFNFVMTLALVNATCLKPLRMSNLLADWQLSTLGERHARRQRQSLQSSPFPSTTYNFTCERPTPSPQPFGPGPCTDPVSHTMGVQWFNSPGVVCVVIWRVRGGPTLRYGLVNWNELHIVIGMNGYLRSARCPSPSVLGTWDFRACILKKEVINQHRRR